jgi:hypothetical protein
MCRHLFQNGMVPTAAVLPPSPTTTITGSIGSHGCHPAPHLRPPPHSTPLQPSPSQRRRQEQQQQQLQQQQYRRRLHGQQQRHPAWAALRQLRQESPHEASQVSGLSGGHTVFARGLGVPTKRPEPLPRHQRPTPDRAAYDSSPCFVFKLPVHRSRVLDPPLVPCCLYWVVSARRWPSYSHITWSLLSNIHPRCSPACFPACLLGSLIMSQSYSETISFCMPCCDHILCFSACCCSIPGRYCDRHQAWHEAEEGDGW